jgi:anti-anti-sigma factor
MDTFEIRAWHDGGIRVIKVTGEFDVSACEPFRAHAESAGAEFVVADIRLATFLDSNALGALIELHNRAQSEGFQLAILRPEGAADRIFTITGADGHLPLYDGRVPILAEMNFG